MRRKIGNEAGQDSSASQEMLYWNIPNLNRYQLKTAV
jgi:hypothetical protein